jgi:hypothetical protein
MTVDIVTTKNWSQNMKNAILHLDIVFHALEEMSKKSYTHNQMCSLTTFKCGTDFENTFTSNFIYPFV